MVKIEILTMLLSQIEKCSHGSHMDWKPGKMRKLFPVREKWGNFEQAGKIREFYQKYWKSEGNLPKILEIWRNFSQFLFLFSLWLLMEVYLLNRLLHVLNSLNKTLKKTGKWKKNTGKVREICQSKNMGKSDPHFIFSRSYSISMGKFVTDIPMRHDLMIDYKDGTIS